MSAPPRRVAILGAPSSGKTSMAVALAQRYGTVWVPEYLREFVNAEHRVPRASDQFHIAATQRAREDAAAARAGALLFCDTSPLMTAVYSRHYFGGADEALARLAAGHANDYAVTLVTSPDIPWVADGLQRDTQQVGAAIHRLLMEELEARAIPYLLLSGDPAQRLAQAERRL